MTQQSVYPVQVIQAAITYENLYTSLGISNPTYDQMPNISYDSPFWQAAAPVMAVIRDDGLMYSLTGSPSGSSITTGFWGDQERYSLCDRVRVKFRTKPTSSTLTPYLASELGTSVENTTSILNVDRYDLLQSARWHKFKLYFMGPMEVETVTPRIKMQGYE